VEMVVGWVGADGCDCSFLRRDGDDGLTPTAKASLAEPGMWGRRVPWVATTPLRGVRVEASARSPGWWAIVDVGSSRSRDRGDGSIRFKSLAPAGSSNLVPLNYDRFAFASAFFGGTTVTAVRAYCRVPYGKNMIVCGDKQRTVSSWSKLKLRVPLSGGGD
jgi:hypothetical protein